MSGLLAPAPRSFLDLWPFTGAELRALLDEAARRKAAREGWPKGKPDTDAPLAGRVLAMIFEKPSTRTRVSFHMAMRQLGGESLLLEAGATQLGRGETVEDTAKVLSRMVDAVMIRANRHEDLLAFAAASEAPVINGLTNLSHPCQILADLMTIEAHLGDVRGKRLAWLGDGNNVCASFIHAAPKLGYELAIATPEAYRPRAADLDRARAEQGRIRLTDDPAEAVAGADAVITDTWVSMGDTDKDARMAALAPFQVTQALMDRAAPHAKFLHCLPAHRDEEMEAAIIDGPRSVVFEEAENRIHAQKAVLLWCFGLIG